MRSLKSHPCLYNVVHLGCRLKQGSAYYLPDEPTDEEGKAQLLEIIVTLGRFVHMSERKEEEV